MLHCMRPTLSSEAAFYLKRLKKLVNQWVCVGAFLEYAMDHIVYTINREPLLAIFRSLIERADQEAATYNARSRVQMRSVHL